MPTCLTPQASFPANASRSATIITAPALKPIPLRENAAAVLFALMVQPARYAQIGDIVIIIAYTQMDEKEARSFTPKVVMLGEGNQPLKSRGTEKGREVAD